MFFGLIAQYLLQLQPSVLKKKFLQNRINRPIIDFGRLSNGRYRLLVNGPIMGRYRLSAYLYTIYWQRYQGSEPDSREHEIQTREEILPTRYGFFAPVVSGVDIGMEEHLLAR